MIKIIEKINLSAKNAVTGITDSLKEEFMARVQLSFGIIQFILLTSIIRNIYISLFSLFMLTILISAEFMNTGLENLTDLVTDEHQQYAKRAKDSAAAAVFIISVVSWIITVSLLVNYLI